MCCKDMILIMIAYMLGGICCGYYLVRLKCNVDIRDQGSGGVGARNVGRYLGRPYFVITLLVDVLKGVAAVELARYFQASSEAVSLVLIAVIAGHIWPLLLGFRGGRGIATAIGAYLSYDPWLAVLLLLLTAGLMVFRRGFILSGLAAFLLLPLAALSMHFPSHAITSLAVCSIIILFAHREHVRKAFAPALPTTEA